MPLLSVNIDHVATLRQARYRGASSTLLTAADRHAWGEPDVARAFHEAEMGGADGITVHLREDRRHVTDRDVRVLRELVRTEFNLEMGATAEMVAIACDIRPHSAMLVPEGRNEVTTEGGLDVLAKRNELSGVVAKLRAAGCRVSAFIDAEPKQITAAADLGFDTCELHTGPYAHTFTNAGGNLHEAALASQLAKLQAAMQFVIAKNMSCNAGHALNYANVGPVASLLRAAYSQSNRPATTVLHIGHAIVARSIFTGLKAATEQMKLAIAQAH